jgi:glutamate-1-semialdehyde 2,1-aminomutase
MTKSRAQRLSFNYLYFKEQSCMSSHVSQSEQWFTRALAVTPGGVDSPVRAFKGVGGTPRFIASANGAYLTDVDGNTLLDYCMSWGPLIFGHQDPEIAAAIHTALARGWTIGTASPYSVELAELITTALPFVEKIRFVNSGTEAVMSALRVARGATGRSKIIKFDGCYHGHVDSLLIRAGSGLAEMSAPDSAGVTAAAASDTLIAPLDDETAITALFERYGQEIAAVIIEPLPANNGLMPQRPEFLQYLREITTQYGALLIFDEVMSGFRIGFGGMSVETGITPDLVTYGKVIGGGFPVGAYGGRRDLMNLVAPQGNVYQAGTLSGNPVAMMAGKACLAKLQRENPFATLAQRTAELGQMMEDAGKTAPFPITVQHHGSKFWLICGEIPTEDGIVRRIEHIPAAHKAHFATIFHGLLERGFYLAPSAFEVGFMATVHTTALNTQLAEAFKEVLKGM